MGELSMVIRDGNLSSHEFWSATVFVFLRRKEIIMFCLRSTMPLDWAWPTLDVAHAGRGVLNVELGT